MQNTHCHQVFQVLLGEKKRPVSPRIDPDLLVVWGIVMLLDGGRAEQVIDVLKHLPQYPVELESCTSEMLTQALLPERVTMEQVLLLDLVWRLQERKITFLYRHCQEHFHPWPPYGSHYQRQLTHLVDAEAASRKKQKPDNVDG